MKRLALLSLFATLAAYPDVVFGGRTFVPVGRVPTTYARPQDPSPTQRSELDAGQVVWMVMPWAHVEREALAHGELPLWDRHSGLGHPLLGNGQTALFYPLHWLVLLAPHQMWLWDLQYLLLRFFAAFGTCLLLRELGARFAFLGAPLGVLAGTFNVLGARADVQAYAVMPWLLLALLLLRKTPRAAVAVGALTALCLFAGHAEPSFAVLFTTALTALFLLKRRELLWALAGGAAGVLVAAPAWLPLLALLRESFTTHGPLASFARAPHLALQWIAPGAFGDVLSAPGYLGGAYAALAVAGLRLRWTWPAALLAVLIHGVWSSLFGMNVPFFFQYPVLFVLALGGICALPSKSVFAGTAVVFVACLTAVFWAPVAEDFADAARIACIAAALAGLLGMLGEKRWAAPALALVCFAELVSFRQPYSKRADPLRPNALTSFLQQREGRLIGERLAMMPNSAAAFGLDDVRLAEALFPRDAMQWLRAHVQERLEWGWLFSADPAAGFDLANPALDELGVRSVVIQPAPTDLRGVFRDGDLVVLDRPTAKPLLSVPGPVEHTANTVRFTAQGPARVVLRELYARGWSATIDGAEVPLLREQIFRAVDVPPGTHEVRMRYLPREWPIAFALSALGLAALYALWKNARARSERGFSQTSAGGPSSTSLP